VTVAYLFWHTRDGARGSAADYEEALAAFHRELARDRHPFLLASAAYRVRGAPWIDGGAGYEDWYLVPDLAALERLNEAAVSARHRAGHDRAAAMAAWGAAGLYAVARGEPAWRAGAVTWLAKPADTPYPAFLAALPATPCLLQRLLVLGPTQEFAAAGELEGGVVVHREPVAVEG
jgi:hypothetical protein